MCSCIYVFRCVGARRLCVFAAICFCVWLGAQVFCVCCLYAFMCLWLYVFMRLGVNAFVWRCVRCASASMRFVCLCDHMGA